MRIQGLYRSKRRRRVRSSGKSEGWEGGTEEDRKQAEEGEEQNGLTRRHKI
jgi:hypothetical protein